MVLLEEEGLRGNIVRKLAFQYIEVSKWQKRMSPRSPEIVESRHPAHLLSPDCIIIMIFFPWFEQNYEMIKVIESLAHAFTQDNSDIIYQRSLS